MHSATIYFALAAFVAGAAAVSHDIHAHPLYKFSYGVHDKHTGDIKSASESRDGELTKGQYSLVQPDGVVRTVYYTVNGDSGFQAHVVNKGVAHHEHQRLGWGWTHSLHQQNSNEGQGQRNLDEGRRGGRQEGNEGMGGDRGQIEISSGNDGRGEGNRNEGQQEDGRRGNQNENRQGQSQEGGRRGAGGNNNNNQNDNRQGQGQEGGRRGGNNNQQGQGNDRRGGGEGQQGDNRQQGQQEEQQRHDHQINHGWGATSYANVSPLSGHGWGWN